jgi:hypothetical protein
VVTFARSSFPERNWSGHAGLDCRGNLGCRVALGIGIESAGCSLPDLQRSPPQPDIQATLGLPCPTRKTLAAAPARWWPCWVRLTACSASASSTASSARDSPRSPRTRPCSRKSTWPALGARPRREHEPAVHRRACHELEFLGYVVRPPDPRDQRAKLIVLTWKGKACVEAGRSTIKDLEDEITR